MVKHEANDPARRAKVLAEKSRRRGTCDLQGLLAAHMYEMNEQGTVLADRLREDAERGESDPGDEIPYGIGHIYSGKVVLYNPKHHGTPLPASPTRSIPSTATSSASSTSSTSTR